MFFFPIGDEDPRPGFIPYATIAIIVINILFFFFQFAVGFKESIYMLGTIPSSLVYNGTFYTLITSMFTHGGLLHLGGNMLFLWIFGDNVEDLLGRFWYVVFYLICGIFSDLVFTVINIHSDIPLVGASGAISGVMGAYILCFPKNNIRNFYFFYFRTGIVKIPAWAYLGFWFIWQVISGAAAGEGGGIAFMAHVAGFLMGMFLILGLPKSKAALDYYKTTIARREWQ
ncbi:MAG: rhomboid family intramembrane serine protease [Chloroflexi bacterium]|nr:rhomboid family intramembrane serine protease [Chloroflexota bacterium]